MNTLLYNYFLLLSFVIVSAEICNLTSFSITYSHEFESNIVQSFNDCLIPANFNYKKIRALSIESENIPTIPAHFIENNEELTDIGIYYSGIQRILPGAFRNLPKLHYLAIRGNNFSSILKGAINTIPNTKSIWLESDEISYIEEQALHIPQLRWISLSNNSLDNWNQEWFGKLDNLEEIEFALNNVRTIRRRAFSNFPKLKYIHLNNNKIASIEPEAFEPFNNLTWLDLRRNQIALLNANSFSNPIRIDYFFIEQNNLNFLPLALLRKLHSDNLSLDFNPWTCSCYSALNKGILLNNITITRFGCAPKTLPICIAFKSRCTEEIYPRGTQKYIKYRKTLSQDQLCA